MPVSKSLNRIPSVKILEDEEEEAMKQGIVAILRSDCERSKAGSIRRTLSADMSSRKWLEQNGFFSPMKKIVSSEVLVLPAADSSSSSSSEGEEEYEEIPNQDDVWRSIQAEKERNQMQKQAKIEAWGSILTQKSDNSLLPPAYVHPLVKRSASTLSENSLEICTESLGSETGSDCFSSHSCSEVMSDGDDEREDRQRVVVVGEEMKDLNPFADLHVAKYKKSPPRPFPPPLSSISGGDGASLHMHSHRENGRLVLEAVAVPPRNYFHAQRQDGRLLLTLIHALPTENEVEEFEKVFDDMQEVDDEADNGGGDGGYEEDVEAAEEESEGKEEEEEFAMEQNLSLPNRMIRVHKSGLAMKKLMAVGNINPTWSKKINKADEVITVVEEEEEEEELQIPQSLPPVARLIPPPPPPAAASFNAYEYFWRNKPTIPMMANGNPHKMNGINGYENQDLVLMKGSSNNNNNKTEQFVPPYLRGCKEARRSLLIWEPYCIATS